MHCDEEERRTLVLLLFIKGGKGRASLSHPAKESCETEFPPPWQTKKGGG